jgi:simple sugar transport system substrate-binding protein
MDETGLKRIKDGKQLFSIDQQPYLQGYLAVSLLNGFVEYGLDLPTKPVLTGPGIVDATNVDATMAGAAGVSDLRTHPRVGHHPPRCPRTELRANP